jgi:hypothetical protein
LVAALVRPTIYGPGSNCPAAQEGENEHRSIGLEGRTFRLL